MTTNSPTSASTGAPSSIEVRAYTPQEQPAWDTFVRKSKNATFMLERSYMDYHAHRFTDASRIVQANGHIVALLPANRVEDEVFSHAGLTYAGFVADNAMTTPLMLRVFDAVLTHFREQGATRLFYKAIPHIYHRLPAEEDLYALFVAKAQLIRRDVSVAIPRQDRARPSAGCLWSMKQAARAGYEVRCTDNLHAFWELLTAGLKERHGVAPVHTVSEMRLLQSRFPERIKLFGCFDGTEMLAGVLVYDAGQVAHSQYIASSVEGKRRGAASLILKELLDREYADKPFFDFGHSNEDAGRRLNLGLIDNKESYGGRAVVYDQYVVNLRAYEPGQCLRALFTWKTR